MAIEIKKGISKIISEYRQVEWPTLRTAVNLAIFVVILSAIITFLILGLDAFFLLLRTNYIIK